MWAPGWLDIARAAAPQCLQMAANIWEIGIETSDMVRAACAGQTAPCFGAYGRRSTHHPHPGN